MSLRIRPATAGDRAAIWQILEPMIRAGDTMTLPRDMGEADALDYWYASTNEVFVAECGEAIAGTSHLRANQQGGGSHVANASFVTAAEFRGRGVARALGEHAIARARERGFRAMQFNFVVASNDVAVKLWERLGFAIVGRLPGAFAHPTLGPVDALVMFRNLSAVA